MARKVFYSFHYARDGWRASKVRNIGVVEGNVPATDNKWEEVKRGGDAAIQRWIDEQLNGRSCTVVLVGAETANRRWIKYEVKKSWSNGDMGVLGIRIHRLLDHNQESCMAGSNPFDQLTLSNGKPMSSVIELYDPPYMTSADVYAYISKNIAQWIESAIASR